MKLVPHWTHCPDVDLTSEQKQDFLDYCNFRNIYCLCDEEENQLCTLCHNVINGRPAPLFSLAVDFRGHCLVFIRDLLTSNHYSRMSIQMALANLPLDSS